MNTTPDFLQEYFEGELKYLKEYFQRVYSASHPEIANNLTLNLEVIDDPSVKTLVNAFALLTARIRKKLDDSLPEIYESLLELAYPDYLCPMPSIATVRFRIKEGANLPASGRKIENRSRLESNDGLGCKFQTCQEVVVWPVRVGSLSAQWDQLLDVDKPKEAKDAVAVIDLELECQHEQGWRGLNGLERLRFFLGVAEISDSLTLYEMLFNDLMLVRFEGTGVDGLPVAWSESPEQAISPTGFDQDEAILPCSDRSFPGFALIRELFAYPSKFLYFDLHGFREISKTFAGKKLKVRFFLKRGPRSHIVIRSESHFHLYCAPAVNLFEMQTDAIPLDQKLIRYEIVPKRGVNEINNYEVYQVTRVYSVDFFKSGGVTEYQPFFRSDHESAGNSAYYWKMTRESAESRFDAASSNRAESLKSAPTGTRCYLSFYQQTDKPTTLSGSTLSIKALCTNRSAPARMKRSQDNSGGAQGEKSDFRTEHDESFAVCLMDMPTLPVYPPDAKNLQWDMISLFSLNYLSLVDSRLGADRLRQLLNTLNLRRSEQNKAWIQTLQKVSHRRISARAPLFHLTAADRKEVLKRPLVQGVGIDIEFQDKNQRSKAFLLASVLNVFFGHFAAANSFTRLTAKSSEPEGLDKTWQPRTGRRQFS